ncbi:Rv3235 family protein [Actinomycetospora chibensis]|uniref:Rv3235 family protein n=1 Tax=Actinomycetospora chibensis TaxID=663606 RepID=A0ABV9RJ69_9PSEU|nr:Rv3235 family protein [Actinomycetospora chibensis]MDD7924873.1 Rv3235 family protein [Actinomycetospora chibensis]
MSVTPLALAPCTAPARARRVGAVPTPRVRPLAEVLPPDRPAVLVDPDDGARTRRAQDELDRLAASLRPVALRLLTAVADVLAGRRPHGDLGPLLHPDALATLVRATRQPAGPRRGTVGAATGPAPRAGLRGLRVCAVGPRTVEVVAVVHGPQRVRALAARLERAGDGPADPGHWRAVALWPG